MATAPALRGHSASLGCTDADVAQRTGTIRRRGSESQGRALEVLGHAVEYLVDSRMFLVEEPATRADTEAVQILMWLSRCVFSECPRVAPAERRVARWVRLVREGS